MSVQYSQYNKFTRHEQVCISGLRFERYFSHHWPILAHDVINVLYYKVYMLNDSSMNYFLSK